MQITDTTGRTSRRLGTLLMIRRSHATDSKPVRPEALGRENAVDDMDGESPAPSADLKIAGPVAEKAVSVVGAAGSTGGETETPSNPVPLPGPHEARPGEVVGPRATSPGETPLRCMSRGCGLGCRSRTGKHPVETTPAASVPTTPAASVPTARAASGPAARAASGPAVCGGTGLIASKALGSVGRARTTVGLGPRALPSRHGVAGSDGARRRLRRTRAAVDSLGGRLPIRLVRAVRADDGMSTAEYAIGTIAAAAFGAVLYGVVTGDSIVDALTGIIDKALNNSV